MATNENLIPIPGRLHSVASDKIVSGADEIYDDELQIFLNDINKDIESTKTKVTEIERIIGSEDTSEDTIINRINNLELSVGEGGSVDQRISDVVNAEKNRAQDIEGGLQTQVNALEIGKQNTLSVGAGITLTQDGVISATANPSVGKVVESLPLIDIIDGMIYLVQNANTPGTYIQWVHYGNDWTNKGEISLSITTDDTLDSTSSNPIQNAAIAALIGYFVCGNGYASSDTKNVDALGFNLPDVGGDFKIKMNEANTHAGPVYLRFNSRNDTKAELKYNRESVSADNSWDAGEVISVYYDGTYYQASNAMGGGSAVGKKKLTPIPGYIENNGDTLGSIHTASADRTNYRYIKYSAKEGDVVQISGTGASGARLWGIVGEEDVMLDAAAINLPAKNLIVVMPEGTTFITINSKTDSNPEWYYAKAGSVGAHEMLSEAYIYGGLKDFAVGQIYDKNDAVKTVYNQRFKIIKEVKAMNLTDEIAIGDLKAITSGANLGTYQAQQAISAYSDTTYSDGDYAIGSPAGAVIQVSVDNTAMAALEEATDITVTIAGIELTITVDSTMGAAGVAAAIYAAFGTQAEWKLTDNENGTLTLISKVAKATAPTISATTGDTGITVQFTEDSAYAGSLNISTFNEGLWTALTTVDEYVALNDVWEQKDIYLLEKNITEADKVQAITIPYNNSNSGLNSGNVNDAIDETAKYSGELLYYKEGTAIAQQNTNFSLLTGFRIIKNHTYRLYIKSGVNLKTSSSGTIKIGIGGANTSPYIVVEDITNGYIWEFVASASNTSSRIYLSGVNVSNVRVYVKIEDITTPSTIITDTNLTIKQKVSEIDSTIAGIKDDIISADKGKYKFIDVTERVGSLMTNDVNYTTVDSSAEEYKQNGIVNIVNPGSSKRFGWYIGALPNNTDIVIDMDISTPNPAGIISFYKSYVTANSIGSIYTSNSGPSVFTNFRPIDTVQHVSFVLRRGDAKHLQVPNSNLLAGLNIVITNFKAQLRYSVSEYERLKHLNESFKLNAIAMTRTSSGTAKDEVYRNTGVLSLLHFSDIHGDGTAAYFIRDFYDNNKDCIDDMLSTGDITVLEYGSDYEFYKNNKLTDALFCVGNHDGAVGGDWDATPRENVYNKYIAPNAESWGIVQPESPDNPLYWYKDYTTQQVRLICIDGVYSQEDTDYLNAELSWFQNLLNETLPNSGSTVQGWKVVICSHYYPAVFNEDSILKDGHGDIVNMHHLSATSITINDGYRINSGFLTALSSFIDNDGKFVIWLCGHYHSPYMAYLANYNNILVMAADAAGTYRGGSLAPAKRVSDLQYSFIANVLVISNPYVRIIRVGCNNDVWLRSVNTLTYDWVNKKVVSEN